MPQEAYGGFGERGKKETAVERPEQEKEKMDDIKKCKEELSKYGVELENGMQTLRVTSRCTPREEDACSDPLEHFIYGFRSQDHNGRWTFPNNLLRVLQGCSCLKSVDYVADPRYQAKEYVDRQAEPVCNDDPVAIAMGNAIDKDTPEYLPDPECGKTSRVMGIRFGFTAAAEIVVDEDNPYFSARDGVLFSKDMTRLIWYPYGKQDETYTVPDGVTEICPWAFAGCRTYIPVRREDGSTVRENGYSKFHIKYIFNKSLRRVILPDTVTVIQDNAFNRCLFLTSVRLSSTLKEIRWDAFRSCKGLRAMEFPDSLEYIEPAFEGCGHLQKVRFLGTRHQISRTWKTHSSSMFSVYPGPIPYSPDFMNYLFKDANISFETPWFTIIDGVMFNYDRTELIWCSRGKSGSYTVPSTVTRIGKRAFADCKELTQVNITCPGTVIEKRAFFLCKKLKRVVFLDSGSVKHIGDHAFHSCEALQEIPLTEAESIGAYAFYACSNLGPEARVSKDCGYIGEEAFDLCHQLGTLYVPKILAGFRYNRGLKGKRASVLLY